MNEDDGSLGLETGQSRRIDGTTLSGEITKHQNFVSENRQDVNPSGNQSRRTIVKSRVKGAQYDWKGRDAPRDPATGAGTQQDTLAK